MPRYQPLDALTYPRFAGISTFMRLPHVTDLRDVDVAILGIPFDTGAVYRNGARFGPQAVRAGSRLLRPFNPTLDVDIFDCLSVVDYGDLPVVPGYIEDSYREIVQALNVVLDGSVIPISVGGDHSIVLAELRAIARRHGPVGLVHFDSHSDTWDRYWGKAYTHGTPFRRAVEEGLLLPGHAIQVGLRGPLFDGGDMDQPTQLGFEVLPFDVMRNMSRAEIVARICERVAKKPVFVSFDIDFIDPAFAPATGTPEIGGPSSADAIALVQGLAGLSIVGGDLVEILPQYDVAEVTAMTGARIIFELLSALAKGQLKE